MTYCLIRNKNNIADINGYGAVNHNFLIQQYFISCEDYCNFLNNINVTYKNFELYHDQISNIIYKNRGVFVLADAIDPKQPISYINIHQLKIYCNWINNQQSLKYLFEFPYNLHTGVQHIEHADFWIPNYNEWYKATYYDPKLEKYWSFPNKSDVATNENRMSAYGLYDAGLKYYTILDNGDNIHAPLNKTIISGGSYNRHPVNAKSGTICYVSDRYYSNYISGRLCKKSEIKKFILKLYDTYGDGWGGNHININDASHKPIYSNITLTSGYGPKIITIEVDKIERNINIKYIKENPLSYENYYEIYDFDSNQLVFKSNMYENPPDNIIIALK